MSPLLFVFLDGVGLGAHDARTNPFVAAATPFLDGLLGGRLQRGLLEANASDLVVRPLDASLGVAGLPQSATGQTTLLTGDNGAVLMGRHYGPWPGPTLRRRLDQGTLFSEVIAAGGTCALANAYPPAYFRATESGRSKVNVPAYAARRAGLPLRSLADAAAMQAVPADLSGVRSRGLDASWQVVEEAESGRRLAALAGTYQLTFFDFWLSDAAGHRWSMQASADLVERLDRFMSGLVPALGDTTLLVTSDHGNLEDKTVRTHTTNPVPLLALGPGAKCFSACRSILDVAPAIRRHFSFQPPRAPAG